MVTLAVTVIVCDMPWRPLPARVLYPLSVNLSYSTPCFHTGPRRMFWTVILRQTHWRRVASPPQGGLLGLSQQEPHFPCPAFCEAGLGSTNPRSHTPPAVSFLQRLPGEGGEPRGMPGGQGSRHFSLGFPFLGRRFQQLQRLVLLCVCCCAGLRWLSL